jgi:sugar phosphate isomerase/epimerase
MTLPKISPAGDSNGTRGSLRFGYGTNGFTNHRLNEALSLLADMGYDGVALTLDHCHLDPFAPDLAHSVRQVARSLTRLGLSVVIETGARYLLDPRRKHYPTLVHDDGNRLRIDFLRIGIDIAAELGAEALSFWSGTVPPGQLADHGWKLLAAGCEKLVNYADARGVTLGFEPEPGMLVAEISDYQRLATAIGEPSCFGLTLDIGHCQCLEPRTVPDCVRQAGSQLVNVQIDDMRRGVHEHLEFGDGEIDFPPVMAALAEVRYNGLISVELPRHSHSAPSVACRSLSFLRSHSYSPEDQKGECRS